MNEAGFLFFVIFGVNAIVGIWLLAISVRLWYVLGEADRFFSRENQRYRLEYERQRRQ